MATREAIWEFIEPTVRAQGLEIYDIELPSTSSRLLRIFLSRPQGEVPVDQGEVMEGQREGNSEEEQSAYPVRTGVALEQCARVSHQISRLEGFDELISEKTTLEVSSPGVNRRLRLLSHFQAACGEHIWIKVYDSAKQGNRALRGTLTGLEDEILLVQEDDQDEVQRFALEDVVSARIDFLFQ